MKKSMAVAGLYLGIGLAMFSAAQACILDANLKAAVEEELGIIDPEPADLQNLTYLNACSRNICSLEGLEYATHLHYLYLVDNRIRDLAPLGNLNSLYELWLDENDIRDISPLSGLTNLQELTLYDNQIYSIEGLSGLTRIEELWLDHNQISDISPIVREYHYLQFLYLNNNPLDRNAYCGGLEMLEFFNSDAAIYYDPDPDPCNCPGCVYFADGNLRFEVMKKLAITHYPTETDMLDLYSLGNVEDPRDFSNVTDLTGLETAVNLNELVLDFEPESDDFPDQSGYLDDLTPLAGLTQLQRLELINYDITDVSPLMNLTQLETLVLLANQIVDIGPLQGMTHLVKLDLRRNEIQDITSLADMASLQTLYLSYNPIDNIDVLADKINLTTLSLFDIQITDITPLANLTSMMDLELGYNAISDISVLTDMTDMWRLSITNNQISDISSLADMTHMRYLYLTNNQISDISALDNKPDLRWLFLNANPLNTMAYCHWLPIIRTNISVLYYDPNPNVLTADCRTDLPDWAAFIPTWQDWPCEAGNTWCSHGDLNHDGLVDVEDFAVFAGLWLAD